MKYLITLLLWLNCASIALGMERPAEPPAGFTLHYFAQTHENSHWGDLLIGFFEQGVENLSSTDKESYARLLLEHGDTLKSQIEIFHKLRALVQEFPDIRVYVEGLASDVVPYVFGGAFHEKLRSAFVDVDFDNLTEAQRVYLICRGAAYVLHAMGEIKGLYGTEDPRFIDQNTQIFSFAHLPFARDNEHPPKGLKQKAASVSEHVYGDDLRAISSRYLNQARETFAYALISSDAHQFGLPQAVLVFGANHTQGFKTKFSSSISHFVNCMDFITTSEKQEEPAFVSPHKLQSMKALISLKMHYKRQRAQLRVTFAKLYEDLKPAVRYIEENCLAGKESELVRIKIAHYDALMPTACTFEDRAKLEQAKKDEALNYMMIKAIEDCSSAEEFVEFMVSALKL